MHTVVTSAAAMPKYVASSQHSLSTTPVVVSVVSIASVVVVVGSAASAQMSGVKISAKLNGESAGHGVVTPGDVSRGNAGVSSNTGVVLVSLCMNMQA